MAPNAKALKECNENGIETIVGCPMMIFGTPVCRVHACFTNTNLTGKKENKNL
jgi:hypothetical protein